MSEILIWARRAQGSHQRGHYVVTTKWHKLPEAVARDAAHADPAIELMSDKEYQSSRRAKASGEAEKEE